MNDQFEAAAKKGDVLGIKTCLDNGGDMYPEKEKALWLAARNGHIEAVSYLLAKGADVTFRDGIASRAAYDNHHWKIWGLIYDTRVNSVRAYDEMITKAQVNGDSERVRDVKNKLADLTSRLDYCLYRACGEGHLEGVKFFVAKGANVNVCIDPFYAMGQAIRKGHTEIVKFLIENGADVKLGADHMAMEIVEGGLEMVKLLFPHQFSSDGLAESYAAEKGHIEIIKFFYENGNHLNVCSFDTLKAAIDRGRKSVYEFILDKVDLKDKKYAGILNGPSKYGDVEAVKMLISRGARINDADADFSLILASEYGHTQIVKILLHYGSNQHVDDDKPLRLAFKNRRTEVVKILLAGDPYVRVDGFPPIRVDPSLVIFLARIFSDRSIIF